VGRIAVGYLARIGVGRAVWEVASDLHGDVRISVVSLADRLSLSANAASMPNPVRPARE
jgi:hypothetical protein